MATMYCEIPKNEKYVIDGVRDFLVKHGIRFETSGCYNNVLFAVDIDAETANTLNRLIDYLSVKQEYINMGLLEG